MKKAIAMLLAGVMTLSLTACSGNTASETNSGTGENNAAGSTAAVQESTASQGGEGGEAENGEVVFNPGSMPWAIIRDLQRMMN